MGELYGDIQKPLPYTLYVCKVDINLCYYPLKTYICVCGGGHDVLFIFLYLFTIVSRNGRYANLEKLLNNYITDGKLKQYIFIDNITYRKKQNKTK